jgi:hypothetical protein
LTGNLKGKLSHGGKKSGYLLNMVLSVIGLLSHFHKNVNIIFPGQVKPAVPDIELAAQNKPRVFSSAMFIVPPYFSSHLSSGNRCLEHNAFVFTLLF